MSCMVLARSSWLWEAEHGPGALSVWGWQGVGDGGVFGGGESLLCAGGVRNQVDRVWRSR